MTEYVEVARAETAHGELVLRRRVEDRAPDVLELRANGVFVMDSRETASEIRLAETALELVADPRDVVIGGLGLGYTLQRVLADPRVERVTVVEIEEDLVAWMRDGTVPHGPAILADRRVRIVVGDIARAVAEATSSYDLVLLDVDNGPQFLVHEENAALYEQAFLAGTSRILNPGGVLAVWSAARSADLGAVLEKVFGNCAEHPQRVVLQEREEEYVLYCSRLTSPG